MKIKSILIASLILITLKSNAQVLSEWRNLGRSGVYNETGLLKQWPESGPKLLWHNDSLPNGHSSAAVALNSIFSTGIIDSAEYLFALGMNGKPKWKTPIGKAWTRSFPESRCTPTIEGNEVYVTSGNGEISCVDASTGKIYWTVDAAKKFGAKLCEWGVAESPIVKDNMVFFSPVGEQTTMVALNKKTGETIWQSATIHDSLAYVSPILINFKGKNILVNISANYVFGIDAATGKVLWNYKYYDLQTPTWHPWAPIIKCVTPLYDNGKLYVTGGYNHVGAMFQLTDDDKRIQLLWSDSVLDNHHGGVLKSGNYIYGSNWVDNGNGNWCCIDWETGKVKYQTKWKTKGSIIADENMLYCYEERTGYLALVPANPEKFEVKSSFKIPYGKGPYWSHPVIKDGILYVRHGTSLMAYDLKNK